MWESIGTSRKKIASVTVVAVLTTVLFLYNWTLEAVQEVHTMPQEKRQSIYTWVRQHHVSQPQLQVIGKQTGLGEETVEQLLADGYWQLLLELQSAYFAKVQTVSVPSSIVTVSEYVVDEQGQYADGTQLADIRTGDILITKNSRFLGWRNGHAGLVVDGEKGLVLEAVMLGTDTKLCSIEKWAGYPAFMVLRLKDGEQTALAAVEYAKENLVDIPYQLLAGVQSRLLPERQYGEQEAEMVLKGTQCAHLVWYAYMQAGVDLDSDGGLLVTPSDIQNSPYLEVIQKFGYE